MLSIVVLSQLGFVSFNFTALSHSLLGVILVLVSYNLEPKFLFLSLHIITEST